MSHKAMQQLRRRRSSEMHKTNNYSYFEKNHNEKKKKVELKVDLTNHRASHRLLYDDDDHHHHQHHQQHHHYHYEQQHQLCCCHNSSFFCYCSWWPPFTSSLLFLLFCFVYIFTLHLCSAAPSFVSPSSQYEQSVWPPLQDFDIWNVDLENASTLAAGPTSAERDEELYDTDHNEKGNLMGNFNYSKIASSSLSFNITQGDGDDDVTGSTNRQSKVIHLFPVPVDGECLSDDGRRLGNCFNAYECRQKGGHAKGECAMGFGVCCVFIANCNETVMNNITYLVSPNFPSFMPSNFTGCNIKVKLMAEDISQLRIDFYHFSLGQPNRRTGVCDGDVFSINGGPSGLFSMCGQNSGQHIYYDVGGRALPRQTALYGSLRPLTYAQLYPNLNSTNTTGSLQDQLIDISLNFTNRFLPIRLWEIRIAQIPFSQRAPAGCLQYHTGLEGVMQTFNFADNGRHLANQHYRICVRQEADMCSIMYQPCDEQSFRIGGSNGMMNTMQANGVSNSGGVGGAGGGGPVGSVSNDPGAFPGTGASTTFNGISTDGGGSTTTAMLFSMNVSSSAASTMPTTTSTVTTANATTPPSTTTTTASTTAVTTATTNASTTAAPLRSSTAASTEPSTASSPVNDEIEGSGDDFDFNPAVTPSSAQIGASRRPRPVNQSSGGFDLLGFLRSAFDLRIRRRRRRRSHSSFDESRQFFSTCTDRITMPCIIEDFIGTGLGPLPGCEPVHCGAQFCSSGVWPCRIESTVTPFYIGVHFGDGSGKGSAEDNIGACLRYAQVQCM